MKTPLLKKVAFVLALLFFSLNSIAQAERIQELEFLLGTWKVREDNDKKTWWEESTRVGHYSLDSTFIELDATAISSTGKKRTYRWYIHYNKKDEQFEMVSMFSNWHKIQFDLLYWDPENRTLTIKHGEHPNSEEYHERFGELVFAEDFKSYIWTGQNKYGDREKPSIWNYIEKGSRVE